MNRYRRLPHRTAWSPVPLLCLLLLFGGCDDDLLPPEPESGALFTRYVALGNSITAGFQSGGINAETQEESYAVLLAGQMETPFRIPALALPGCPPPLTQLFPEPDTLGGPNAPSCALRTDAVPMVINNVAVPGATVRDAYAADTGPNPLTTLLLSGRTQIEAAEEVHPTFASVWIGNNDVLRAARTGAVNEGVTYTAPATFEQHYMQLLDSLRATGVEGGVLVGVANVTLIPNLSAGAAYLGAEQAGAFPPAFDVAANCAPEAAGAALVPFQYGFGYLLPRAEAGTSVTLDCEDNRPLADIYGLANVPDALESVSIVTPRERQTLETTVQAYNDVIASAADDLGWAYLDPNTLFAQSEIRQQIPPLPDTEPDNETPPFGPLFSLDGVHPSARAHALVTDALIRAVNETYATDIPPLSPSEAP